jgi:hypothetical protein
VLDVAEMRGAWRFDEQRRPWRFQCIGDALGGAHQSVRSGQLGDGDDDAVAARPGATDAEAADVLQHLRVDRLRRAAPRQFA